MIFVVDDDEVMARCIGRATGREFRVFRDGVAAMAAMGGGSEVGGSEAAAAGVLGGGDGEGGEMVGEDEMVGGGEVVGEVRGDEMVGEDETAGELPEMIFLDVLLNGPDGFTLLNELLSYEDTARIPVVVVSSLDLTRQDLSEYGVRAVLRKETMRPEEIRRLVREVAEAR